MGELRIISPTSHAPSVVSMTTAERDALSLAEAERVRVIWSTTVNKLEVWTGATWRVVMFE